MLRSRAREAAWVLGFLALFLAAYVSSGFALHPDAAWFFFLRTTPAWIGCVLLFAGAVATLEEVGGRARAFGSAAFAVVLAVGVVDLGRLIADGRPSAPLENLRLLATRQGYDWSEYFDKLLPRLDGTVDLYAPAPNSAFATREDLPSDRLFTLLAARATDTDVAARLAKEIRFDSDVWVVAIEDRQGRPWVDVAKG